MPLLIDIILILGLGAVVVYFCQKVKIPPIVGFLLSGILAGPQVLGLMDSHHKVEVLAEIGVVLLLFSIGLEFSLKKFLEIKKTVLLGGTAQVLLTILVVFGIAIQYGRSPQLSLFIGFMAALSSTAIVLNLLQAQAEVDTPSGRTILAILIFQDFIIVPMLLLTPILAGAEGSAGGSGLVLAGKGAAVVAALVIAAKYILPRGLDMVTGTRSRELFIISVVLICFTVALLTYSVGLSLALGAFLAGLIISESPYSHQAVANILPLKDIFTSIFFISIGMLADVGFLFAHPALILVGSLVIIFFKTISGGLAALILGFPLRVAAVVGFSLAQVGEFSFLLAQAGWQHGLLGRIDYQMFLDIAVLTMALTPLAMRTGSWFSKALTSRRAGFRGRTTVDPKAGRLDGASRPEQRGHVVVVGFGVGGRGVARAAELAGLPYVVIEMNPATVRKEKQAGRSIIYGDASYGAVLEHVNITEARVLVITIPDPVTVRRIISTARDFNGNLHIIARTRFLQEIGPMQRLGANEVVVEEYETAVEIFTRVLQRFYVPRGRILNFVNEMQADNYEMLRDVMPSAPVEEDPVCDLLAGLDIVTFRVQPDAPAVNQTLTGLALREKYGITVLAVKRGETVMANPAADFTFQEDDLVFTLGLPENVTGAQEVFWVE